MFKNWSLRFLVYKVIVELFLGIIYFNQPVVLNLSKTASVSVQSQPLSVLVFQFLSGLFFVLGLLFLILSLIKKEAKDWKWYIALLGWGFMLLIALLSLIL